MKTFQILNHFKYPVLILMTFIGTLIFGTQSTAVRHRSHVVAETSKKSESRKTGLTAGAYHPNLRFADHSDIGGQSAPRTSGVPIGGKASTRNYAVSLYCDHSNIGGNGNAQPKPVGPPLGTSDIGGQNVPRLPMRLSLTIAEIGGNGSQGSKPKSPSQQANIGGTEKPRPILPEIFASLNCDPGGCERPKTGLPVNIGNLPIGVQSAPRSFADIGGTQSVPRSIDWIGGQGNPPGTIDIGGSQLPPRV